MHVAEFLFAPIMPSPYRFPGNPACFVEYGVSLVAESSHASNIINDLERRNGDVPFKPFREEEDVLRDDGPEFIAELDRDWPKGIGAKMLFIEDLQHQEEQRQPIIQSKISRLAIKKR